VGAGVRCPSITVRQALGAIRSVPPALDPRLAR
jgi:hypothetical protein